MEKITDMSEKICVPSERSDIDLVCEKSDRVQICMLNEEKWIMR